MDEFLGSDYFSGGGFGDDAILPDLDLQNAFQSWLSDGNEGTFSDFMAEANGQDASSSDDASGNDAASDKTDTSLIAPERDKFEYGGLLSGKPMIGLDRSIMQPSEAAPPVSGRSFMSFAGVPTSGAQPLDAQPIGDQYGPPIMPLTVESRVNVDRLTPPAQGFLDKIGSEHFPGLRAISGFRDPEHNRRVGGASGSRHTIGDAIDFDVSQLDDESKQRFMNIATDSGARGIGVYPSGRSVHVDFRETPAVWGGNRNNTYSGNLNPSAYPEWAQPTVSAFAEGNTGRSQNAGAPQRPDASPFASEIRAASQATGVPEDIIRAKLMQESGFDPNARGRAGEIGLAQIMPSTARDPGFGVNPIDPAELRDPAKNIMFGAQYLAGRARAAGVTDWNDPEQRNLALTRYNGGGDPNYAANVSRYIQPAAFAADDARASAVNRAPDASAFRGSNDRPFETFPTTQAEIISDTTGLLSGNRAMSGPAPLSNMPTIPGAIIPDRLIGEAAPGPMPSAIRTAPANARQLRAKNPQPDEIPAPPRRPSDLNTGARRMNELPPEYFTADTGGSGMGAMRFMESEFARREGQQPPTFGGLGAAISGGAASVGSAVRNALGLGGGETLPPPPLGQEPVARAMPVADQRVGDQRINPPMPQLGMITWGEGGQRNAALLEKWRGQVRLVDELERLGIPRSEGVGYVDSPQALQLRLATLAEERNRAKEIAEREKTRAVQEEAFRQSGNQQNPPSNTGIAPQPSSPATTATPSSPPSPAGIAVPPAPATAPNASPTTPRQTDENSQAAKDERTAQSLLQRRNSILQSATRNGVDLDSPNIKVLLEQVDAELRPINQRLGRTQITNNTNAEKAYDATVNKATGEQFNLMQSQGRNATQTLGTLKVMEQLIGNPNFYSGFGGPIALQANRALSALGIKDATAASPSEVFQSLSNQVVLNNLGGSLGTAISNADVVFMQSTVSNLNNTPEGNRAQIALARAVAQRQQVAAQMARDYAKANNGRIDSTFEDQMAQWAEANPLVTPELMALVNKATPQSNAAPAAPPAARPSSPQPGDVVDRWRFKGGNPADRNNWEQER